MIASDWVRITPSKSPGFPYSWRCTAPDASSYTGECGASSFAGSEEQATMHHRAHYNEQHGEES